MLLLLLRLLPGSLKQLLYTLGSCHNPISIAVAATAAATVAAAATATGTIHTAHHRKRDIVAGQSRLDAGHGHQ